MRETETDRVVTGVLRQDLFYFRCQKRAALCLFQLRFVFISEHANCWVCVCVCVRERERERERDRERERESFFFFFFWGGGRGRSWLLISNCPHGGSS